MYDNKVHSMLLQEPAPPKMDERALYTVAKHTWPFLSSSRANVVLAFLYVAYL